MERVAPGRARGDRRIGTRAALELRSAAARLATEQAAALVRERMNATAEAGLLPVLHPGSREERVVSTLADHYADALADVAIQQNSVAQIRQQLADFLLMVRESPDLALLLDSPAVQRANKRAVIEALVAQMGASGTLRNFLFVVVDRGRTRLLLEIQASFDKRLDERQGIVRADVSSARELADQEKAELRGALERLTGRRVEAAYRLDPALLAGTVVRVGSTIYDGSVRTQLEKMRERMASE